MNDDQIFDTDIPWRLRPVPQTVASPLDPSTPDEIGLVYADVVALEVHLSSVEADLVSYRELVQVSLERITALTALLQRSRAVIARQAEQIRRLAGMVAVDGRTDPDGDAVSP